MGDRRTERSRKRERAPVTKETHDSAAAKSKQQIAIGFRLVIVGRRVAINVVVMYRKAKVGVSVSYRRRRRRQMGLRTLRPRTWRPAQHLPLSNDQRRLSAHRIDLVCLF